MKLDATRYASALPLATAICAVAALGIWWTHPNEQAISERLPGADQSPGGDSGSAANPVLAGKLIQGNAQPETLPGLWPQFRGPNRDGISSESVSLAHSWDAGGPRQLWSVDCGEGYAGPAIQNGRVYLMDYDYDTKQNALRCLSFAHGGEIWRYSYPMPIKRNHGMTRTVPAVSDKFVVAMDPKCHVLCLDAISGEFRWGLNLVAEFGATVPPWYAGQCILIDGSNVVLAPGGHNALLAAVDLETGKTVWRSPNPHDWKMTHSSVMPMEFAGRRFYVYCGSGGMAGISAQDGSLLWETTAWKISIATVPSPLVLNDGKILVAGGYNAGSLLLQLQEREGKIVPEILWKLAPEDFGATQHTPIFHDGHLFGTRPSGQFVCLGLDGKVVWTSPAADSFGLGPFLLANGVFFVMNDSGNLSLLEESSTRFNLLAQAQILKGRESWGPMALAGGRLLVRDFTHLVCVDVSSPSHSR